MNAGEFTAGCFVNQSSSPSQEAKARVGPSAANLAVRLLALHLLRIFLENSSPPPRTTTSRVLFVFVSGIVDRHPLPARRVFCVRRRLAVAARHASTSDHAPSARPRPRPHGASATPSRARIHLPSAAGASNNIGASDLTSKVAFRSLSPSARAFDPRPADAKRGTTQRPSTTRLPRLRRDVRHISASRRSCAGAAACSLPHNHNHGYPRPLRPGGSLPQC